MVESFGHLLNLDSILLYLAAFEFPETVLDI